MQNNNKDIKEINKVTSKRQNNYRDANVGCKTTTKRYQGNNKTHKTTTKRHKTIWHLYSMRGGGPVVS